MKKFGFFLFFVFLAIPVLGKPVQKTSLKKGCADAKVIVIAQIIKHQYEAIPDRKTISVDRWSLWREYKIIEILKTNKKYTAIQKGKTIRLTEKSNSCIRYPSKVSRQGNTLTILHYYRKPPAKQIIQIQNVVKSNRFKVLLFIGASKNPNSLPLKKTPRAIKGGFSEGLSGPIKKSNPGKNIKTPGPPYIFFHYGWFLSPNKWTKKLEKKVRKFLALNQKTCPKCKSSKSVIPIVYGKPARSLVKKAQEGKVHLGGCQIYRGMPHWYCKKCKKKF